jgi:Ca-activated chloride channel family protein
MKVEFANPSLLLLALAVPPLIAWWLSQGRNALRHSAAQQAAGPLTLRAGLARWGGAGLRALALLLLVVAASGPRTPDLRTRIETEGVALVMVVDVSGSMGERDFEWDLERVRRIDAVKRAFRLFVAGGTAVEGGADGTAAATFEGRPTDLIGLVTFAARPEKTCPLTLSHSAVLRLLDAAEPMSVPGESETNISDALAVALYRLQGEDKDQNVPKKKALILLTDGEHNVVDPRSGWTPTQAGHLAVSLNVPIYTIDAGGDLDESNPTRVKAKETLDRLAAMTKGQAFQARDTAALLKACQAIDKLERANIQSFQYRRYHEAYPWFALTSFVVFLLGLLLDVTLWRRVP